MSQEKFLGGIISHLLIKEILFQNGQKKGMYIFIYLGKHAEM